MKIAFVHEWLETYAGSERVLEQMLHCYPDADLFSLVDFLDEDKRGFVLDKPTKQNSFIQRLPFARKRFRSYLPLFPIAIQQLDLSGYDVVVSSSHCVAKGIITSPDQLHLCMIYSPVRYAWDLQHQYLEERGIAKGLKTIPARWILHNLRQWDVASSHGVDLFISISDFVGARVQKCYRRDSEVIYPPVYTDDFTLMTEKEDFYLAASRLVPYKRFPLIAEAFAQMPDKKLVIIGDGTELDVLKKIAERAPNVTVMGYQSFEVLKDHMQRAKAFVFAPLEDFGIIPLEAQACGTPVIAYGKGGAKETIVGLDAERPTGVFFMEQTVEAIKDAVGQFEAKDGGFTPEHCRENALRFSVDRFRKEFTDLVEAEATKFFL